MPERQEAGSHPPDDTTEKDLSDVLSDPYTRHLLRRLREEGGEMTLRELARGVASRVTDDDTEEIDEEIRRQIEIFLHHGQLPALSRHEIVQYDPEEGLVSLGDRDIDV